MVTNPKPLENAKTSMTVQAVLNCYLPYLTACRDTIVAELEKTPGTAVLAGFFQGGKMFRALLAFVAASAIGIELGMMVPVASALELMHGASLIHDDIVDETKERRGRPALHVQVGLGPALILGDYLMLRSFTVLGASQHVFGLHKVMEATNTLNAYAQACCLGELRELRPATDGDHLDEYFKIVEGKTASQFAAAITLPAILGGATRGEIDALRTYALNVGIMYQIQDDVLDIDEDTELLDQPGERTRVDERLLLPLLYLERYGSPTAMGRYRRILQTNARRNGQLGVLLSEEGIFDRIRTTQARYLAAALQALDRLRPSDARTYLFVLAYHAIDLRAQLHQGLDRHI